MPPQGGPARDAGQPAEGTNASEDQAESLTAQNRHRVVDVGLDKAHVISGPSREGARGFDRGRREVQPGHLGTEAGKADRVSADVALQVHSPHTPQVPEQASVELDHVTNERRVIDVSLQVVVGRIRVRGRTLIPVGSVKTPVVVHNMHPDTVPTAVALSTTLGIPRCLSFG